MGPVCNKYIATVKDTLMKLFSDFYELGSRLTIQRLIFVILGVSSFLSFFSLFFLAWNTQRTLESEVQRDLSDFVEDSESVIARIAERFTLAAETVARDRAIQYRIDNPNASVDVTTPIAKQKILFRFETAFLFTDSGRLLRSDTPDSSFLVNPQFQKMVADATRFKSAQVVILESFIYQRPVFFVALRVIGQERSGVIVYGKVLDEEFLKSLFPSEKRGVFFITDKGRVSSSNIQDAKIHQVITTLITDIMERVNITSDHFVKIVNTDKFHGAIHVTILFLGPNPIGKVGFFIDASELFALQRNIVIITLFFLLFIIVFFIVVLLIVNRILLGPMRAITDGISKMSHGALTTRIRVFGTRELHEISSSFNTMAESIEKSQAELETKIRERTKELESNVQRLERMNTLMVGREIRMIEFKKEIEELKKKTQ